MTMRSLYNNVAPVVAIAPQTITSSALVSGDIDLDEFNSAMVALHAGNIAEMGDSPEGGAQIAVKIEHADDDGTGSAGTYSNVTAADVVGPASVSSGVVATLTDDLEINSWGYVGDKRFIRVTLTPTGLSSGGPVSAMVLKGHPRHGPAQS